MLNRIKNMLNKELQSDEAKDETPKFLPTNWDDMKQADRIAWAIKNKDEIVKQVQDNPANLPQEDLNDLEGVVEDLEEMGEIKENDNLETPELDSIDEYEEPPVSDKEIEAAREQLAEQDVDITLDEEMTEIDDLTEEERAEMDNLTEDDPEYLEYSAEAVGYENRQNQWDTYRIVSGYFEDGDSILDFGCGRGDFERFFNTEFQQELEYTGIDFNQQLIDAGKKAYKGEVELICKDWFKIDRDLSADWCMNVNSSNLRYDADTTRSDEIYLKDSITKMMQHCTKGSIILLSSDLTDADDGLINFNPGDLLNWAQKEFKSVAVDHSFATGVFAIVIYK